MRTLFDHPYIYDMYDEKKNSFSLDMYVPVNRYGHRFFYFLFFAECCIFLLDPGINFNFNSSPAAIRRSFP